MQQKAQHPYKKAQQKERRNYKKTRKVIAESLVAQGIEEDKGREEKTSYNTFSIVGKDEVGSSNLPSSSKSLESSDSRLFSFCFSQFPAGKVKNLIYALNSQTASFFPLFGERKRSVLKRKIRMNEHSGTSLKEVWESFVISQTARGVSEATIKNYHNHLKSISHHINIEMPMEDLYKRHLEQMIVSMRRAGLHGEAVRTADAAFGHVVRKARGAVDRLSPSYQPWMLLRRETRQADLLF